MNFNELLVYGRFESIAKRYPKKTALIYGEEQISFAEMHDRIDVVYTELKKAGVKSGHIVAVHGERSPEYLITILAILKVNGVFLPLDSKLPEKRKEWIISDSECSFLIDDLKDSFSINSLKKKRTSFI